MNAPRVDAVSLDTAKNNVLNAINLLEKADTSVKPGADSPATGDNTSIASYVCLAVMAVPAGAAMLAYRKREVLCEEER